MLGLTAIGSRAPVAGPTEECLTVGARAARAGRDSAEVTDNVAGASVHGGTARPADLPAAAALGRNVAEPGRGHANHGRQRHSGRPDHHTAEKGSTPDPPLQ